MHPTQVYQEILRTITDDKIRAVANVMIWHVGAANAIDLPDLARAVFGKVTESTTRATREILETLTVEYHLPVCSLSGKAGRWLAADEEEREQAARELEDRGRHTLDRAAALRRASIPAVFQPDNQPTQMGLWGG